MPRKKSPAGPVKVTAPKLPRSNEIPAAISKRQAEADARRLTQGLMNAVAAFRPIGVTLHDKLFEAKFGPRTEDLALALADAMVGFLKHGSEVDPRVVIDGTVRITVPREGIGQRCLVVNRVDVPPVIHLVFQPMPSPAE